MPLIPRRNQLIFGGNLVVGGNIAEFGTLQNPPRAYSGDPDAIQTAQWGSGWNGAVVGNQSPTRQDLTAVDYLFSYQLLYLLAAGIPEWNAQTTYMKGDLARFPGRFFTAGSLTDNNVGNDPRTDSNNWTTSPLSSPAAARSSGNQNVTVDGLGHRILLPDAYMNVGTNYNVGTSQFTAPFAGNYMITAQLQIDNSLSAPADPNAIEFGLWVVSASTVILGGGASVKDPSGKRWYPNLAGPVALAAGQVIELQLEANTAPTNAGQVVVSNSRWSINRMP